MTQTRLTRRTFLATAGATLGAMHVSGTGFPKDLGAGPRPTVSGPRSNNRSSAFCHRQAHRHQATAEHRCKTCLGLSRPQHCTTRFIIQEYLKSIPIITR